MSAILRLKKEHFDTLLIANIANSLIPAIKTAKILHISHRFVLIAHRAPTKRFLHLSNRLTTMIVVAVNKKIASHFNKDKFIDVQTWYGITNADNYHPAPISDRSNLPFRFCVLGQLDNAWKGADTAVEAFCKLPETTRTECELHLASFTQPPIYSEKNIIVYNWMETSEIPDFLRSMDAMLVPSRDEKVMRETFSQAIVQGMLTALPILASNLPILTEKLDKGGGYIFNTVDELSMQMKRLSEDRTMAQQTGETAKKIAQERYIWKTEIFAERFL
jgi:glycosyltransferase involved in cell wall biosynthesis